MRPWALGPGQPQQNWAWLVAHAVRYGFFTFLRAALLKLCSMLQTTGLGPGLIRAAERTSPQPGLAGLGPQRTLQHSAVGPPSTSDDHGAVGCMGGVAKVEPVRRLLAIPA